MVDLTNFLNFEWSADWAILLIAIAVVGSLGALVAIKTRAAVDRNHDGIVNPEEVPIRVQNNFKPVIVQSPGLYDLTIASLYRTIVESFLHAFCYGCQTVFLCNIIMGPTIMDMDERYSYLFTTTMVFMACMFMCMYSNNGVHILTKHVIHFVYYSCAFLSLFFLWTVPDPSGLVAVYALSILLTYTAGRYYGLPNYPSMQQIVRLYKYDNATGEEEWILGSTPQLLSGDIGTEVEPLRSEYAQWAITCPTFEVFNRLMSSSFTIGVTSAVVVHLMLDATTGVAPGTNISLYISISVAALAAFLYHIVGPYGRTENKMNHGILVPFWPKLTCMFSASLGAAATVANLAHRPPADGGNDNSEEETVSTIVTWIGYGALGGAITMTYGISIVATRAFLNQQQEQYRAEF